MQVNRTGERDRRAEARTLTDSIISFVLCSGALSHIPIILTIVRGDEISNNSTFVSFPAKEITPWDN
jgi:hypothetical protein